MTYKEKLKLPAWQKKRLEILQRDNWECKLCGEKNKNLHVHHINYIYQANPEDHPNHWLITICEDCHIIEERFKSTNTELMDIIHSIGLTRNQIHYLFCEISSFFMIDLSNNDKNGLKERLYELIDLLSDHLIKNKKINKHGI